MNTSMIQVINAAPLNSTNPTGQSIYSGPAYWPGNGGQVFFRGRRSNQALYRCVFESLHLHACHTGKCHAVLRTNDCHCPLNCVCCAT